MITDTQYQEWLKLDNQQRVLLLEVKYYYYSQTFLYDDITGEPLYDDVTGEFLFFRVSEENIKYLSSAPYISKPTDTPPNQPYDDSIIDVPKFSSILGDVLDGYTVPSWGDVIIDNSLFDKDEWFDFAWDGRTASLLLGSPKWSRSDFRSLLTGTITAAPVANGNLIKLSIKDKQWELNKPIQTQLIGDPVLISGNTYSVSKLPIDSIDEVWDAGVLVNANDYTTSPSTQPATFTLNYSPAGRLAVKLTGGATAVGDVVPLCYGEVFNITPKSLSTAFSDVNYIVYQIQGAPVYEIPEVRDGGIPVAFTPDLNESDFILTSSPVSTVTCDVKGSTSGGIFVESVGRIARWILLNQSDLTFNDIDNTSLSAFIDKCPQRVGVYINSRKNILDVLDELFKSVGGFYTPNRNGKMIFGRIEPTIENPVMYITADDVIFGSLKIVKKSIPWQTVRLGYARNYTVQASTHGAVSEENKTRYAQEWRYVTKTDPSIKTTHVLALEPDVKNTCLVDESEAYAEAERQLALHGVVRTTYSIDYIGLTTLNLGEVVNLTYNRYGLNVGKNLYIVGITESMIARKTTLLLWG